MALADGHGGREHAGHAGEERTASEAEKHLDCLQAMPRTLTDAKRRSGRRSTLHRPHDGKGARRMVNHAQA